MTRRSSPSFAVGGLDSRRDLFTRLGGTRAMAGKLGEPPSTVQSWKAARRIPAHKQPAVLALGVDDDGIPITADDVVFPFGRDAEPELAKAS